MKDILPIGAVVDYKFNDRCCKMVIVAQSPGSDRDPETLYFAVEYRGEFIYMKWPDLKLYSVENLIYQLESGWTVGNADRHLFTDTGKRVKVGPYVKPKIRDDLDAERIRNEALEQVALKVAEFLPGNPISNPIVDLIRLQKRDIAS